MSAVSRDGTTAYIGLPEREATKLQDLWQRDEIGVELSVEVHAPVVIGVYPMRIARFVVDQTLHANGNGHVNGHANGHPNGHAQAPVGGMVPPAAGDHPPMVTRQAMPPLPGHRQIPSQHAGDARRE